MGDNWCFGAGGSEVVRINTYIPDVLYGVPSTLLSCAFIGDIYILLFSLTE